MSKYPYLKTGVMLYCENKANFFLLNPFCTSLQKLSRLDIDEASVLKKITGNNKIKDISRSLKIPEKKVLQVIKKFSTKEQGAIKLLDKAWVKLKSRQIKNARYHNILDSIQHEFNSARKAKENNEVIKVYHREMISDPIDQFNKVEMTVSHAYREPHILLGENNYGAAFADVLIKKGIIKGKIKILEVGGGLGIFGKSFLDRIKQMDPEVYKTIKYVFLDFSPALYKSQKKMSRSHHHLVRFIYGDIENYDFQNEKFDLVISNEMVADLNIVKLKKDDFDDLSELSQDKKRAVEIINKFDINISDAPREFLFNLKAVEFLILIKKILNPGGKAYVIEYGSRWEYPKVLALPGHVEYSIHFGHLKRVAQKLYLNPKLTCLTDFLNFDKHIKVVDFISWFSISNYLLPFLHQKSLSKNIYTKEMMREEIGDVFDRLLFVSFSHLGTGDIFLDPSNFLVLELES